ncbi:protein phosphatase 2C domain-containing protein [Kitasatospora sp. GAS1066B]|uniref:protein phosphatase 2C domain-containing protein n=1 Tax=Kitasatospora sp. GAS1066B TaxID=3156271 RepID=UPI003518237B
MTTPEQLTVDVPSPALTEEVVLAGRAGSAARPSEDRILTTSTAVIVLDGVSTVGDEQPRGAWYAQTLGELIARRLTEEPGADLRLVLEAAIDAATTEHGLQPGASPAATVAIARAAAGTLDVLVLGDSPVIVADRSGAIQQVRDDRLANLVTGRPEIAEVQQSLLAGHGFGEYHHRLLRDLRTFQLKKTNRPGGYWVAEAVPQAARHAVTARFPLREVAAVLAMTDGVSCAVEDYGLYSWSELIAECASAGPAAVLGAIVRAETQDPDGRVWPRYKQSDDKAAVFWPLPAPTALGLAAAEGPSAKEANR